MDIQEGYLELEKMDKWYSEHFEELVDKYPGKTIAVINEKIVAIEETEKKAYQIAQNKYPNSIPLVVYIPINEELECLL